MKKFAYIVLAALALLASCDELPVPTTEQTLSVNINSKTLEATHGTFVLQVESNTEWTVTSSAEWLTTTQSDYKGSAGVLFSYTDNTTDKSRNAKIVVAPKEEGATASWNILVSQKGSSNSGGNNDGGDDNGDDNGNDNGDDNGDDDIVGSGRGDEDDPYNVARIVEILTNGYALPDTPQYVKGIISSIEEVSTSFGNATFYISDSGNTYTTQLLIYRSKYLNGEDFTSTSQISVGDEVVIVGTPSLYKETTPEMSPCSIYSLNGKTSDDGGSDDGGNDDGGNDDGGNTSGGNTGSGITSDTHTGWAELPAIVDANGDGRHDSDSSLYYTSHLCDGGEKNAQKNGKARNFTVCFSAEHHVPMWVAAPRHDCYESGVSRQNNYKKDPTLPADIQYHSKDTGGGCNKGHMLGSAERLSSRSANSQVMYFSNIAPQLSSGYNTGGGGWNTLEDWVDGQSCRDTLYQVIGCYFDRYTDGYGYTVSPKTISFGGRSDVSMPTMFYCVLLRTKSGSSGKSVINCSASELKCAAFVRSHTNSLKGQKVTRSEMMSVAELEKLTGFTFFVNVPNAPKTVCNPSDWGL